MANRQLPINASRDQGIRIAAYLFACVAGYVDAYALIRFQVYASFMSGNTTRGGVEAAAGQFSSVGLSLLTILFFVIGAFTGVAILHSPRRRAGNLVVIVSLGLLIAHVLLNAWHPAAWHSVALLSASMGALNSTITQIGGQPVNIGYVSGGLHKLAEHLGLAWRRLPVEASQGPTDTHLRRAALIAAIWGAFLIGAFFGALMERHYPQLVMGFPIAALIAMPVARSFVVND